MTLIFDALDYHNLALGILNGSWDSTFRMPGYPAFIAAIYAIMGIDPVHVALVQLVIHIVTAFILYDQTGRKSIMALFLFDPLPLMYSLDLLSETLFALVFLISVVAFIRKRFVVSALSLGASIYIRPVAQFLPLIMIPIMLASGHWRKVHPYLLVVLLCLLPWAHYNQARWEEFGLTTQGGSNLLLCNVALMESCRTGEGYDSVRAKLAHAGNPWEASRAMSREAVSMISAHPWSYTLVHARGCINMMMAPNSRAVMRIIGCEARGMPDGYVVSTGLFGKVGAYLRTKSPIELILGALMTTFALAGYVLAFRGAKGMLASGRYYEFSVLVITVLYFVLITGPIGDGRLRIPVIPVYLLFTRTIK